eukprot:3381037-Rhodomonas_salina.2
MLPEQNQHTLQLLHAEDAVRSSLSFSLSLVSLLSSLLSLFSLSLSSLSSSRHHARVHTLLAVFKGISHCLTREFRCVLFTLMCPDAPAWGSARRPRLWSSVWSSRRKPKARSSTVSLFLSNPLLLGTLPKTKAYLVEKY